MKSDRPFEGEHARSSAFVSLLSDVFNMDPLWTDVATPLLSALLGGFLVALPSIWATIRADRKHRRSVASAFRGEIGSIIRLYETRGYLALHQERLDAWTSGGEPVTFTSDFDERQRDRIYEALASEIGALPEPAPEQVVTFYTLLDAVHEDLGKMSRGVFEHEPRAAKLAFYQHFVSVMGEMLSAADVAQATLQTYISDRSSE